ncbi:Telobox protein [Lachnellula suecica]|uniref:Telobox protein n=1 Tax=Lachnellula suecica TaxID=602035 RepID=A0A8T9C0Z8_9HELO|nr:Telobox protein [Lachnellula suecica]
MYHQYGTIEPRLIALLNDEPSETYATSPSLELPPLNRPSILNSNGRPRPLLLEPASTRNSNSAQTSSAPLGSQHPATLKSTDEEETGYSEGKQQSEKAADRALGSSSPQSLRKILDDGSGAVAIVSSKKRLIATENNKDEFVQLPQPPKKHKTAKQVVPPIIIGLFEPPPQAALFPPIASSSFHDSHGRNSLNTIPTSVKDVPEVPPSSSPKDAEEKSPAVKATRKRKDVKARKKWTEEETNNLLLGVYKHGVGNWTEILEDPTFSFNERSGADLKDRFRTCCPVELRENNPNGKGPSHVEGVSGKSAPQEKLKSSLLSENILIENDDAPADSNVGDGPLTKARKTHRKKMEDLAQLGIAGPFRKSHRRERRPFTEEEDREILEGYDLHGPAWTRIQRDSKFHLQSRQPTDLRDRFRNKFPERFKVEDKGDASSKETPGTQSNQSSSPFQSREKGKETLGSGAITSQVPLPPFQSRKPLNDGGRDAFAKEIVATAGPHPPQAQQSREALRIQGIISSEDDMSKALPPQPQGFFSSFSDQSTLDTSESLQYSQSFDWGGSMTAPFPNNMGEMDIARLLLDESWIVNSNSSAKEKNLTDMTNMISSGPDHPNIPSFYNLPGEVEADDSPFG